MLIHLLSMEWFGWQTRAEIAKVENELSSQFSNNLACDLALGVMPTDSFYSLNWKYKKKTAKTNTIEYWKKFTERVTLSWKSGAIKKPIILQVKSGWVLAKNKSFLNATKNKSYENCQSRFELFHYISIRYFIPV